MRREETLSAKGKKRERHIEKKVMEAIRRRPPSPERGAQHITQDVPQPSLRIFRAARCRVPAHRYHRRVRTRKVFARAMAHNTRSPFPVQVHSRRVIWGCQGWELGNTLAHIMHRRTQYGHQHTPTTSCLSSSSRARRGGARLSQRPHPTTATNSLAGKPRGPSPAAPGSPEAPAFLAVPHPRIPGRPTVAGAGLSSWKRPPVLYTIFFLHGGHIHRPPKPTRDLRPPLPGQSWGPYWNFLAGSSGLCPATLLPPLGPGPHGPPFHPFPGPGRPCSPRAESAALPRSSRRCVHM